METPDERRTRVTAIVAAKWPKPLSPNRFVNAILDIVRGEAFDEADVPEAVDALAWRHLGESIKWGERR